MYCWRDIDRRSVARHARRMMAFAIRDAREDDFDRILALNAESVHFLSPLDKPKLRRLHTKAAYHRVVDSDGTISAFLLAFREGAAYDSPNFRWFVKKLSAISLYRSHCRIAGFTRKRLGRSSLR